MTIPTAAIRSVIARHLPELVALRRDLHAHPEIGYEEHRTAGVIARELARAGVPHRAGLAGGTGVLGHVAGAPGPAIALRADIDALPIAERTGASWASTTPGTMHACGHDGHTTILLGAARVLAELALAGTLPRPVVFVFQPAEENGAGGRRMVAEGCLDGRAGAPVVGEIYGLHGWPPLDLGLVATRPGPMLAAVDTFDIVVRGKGSHAAFPHLGRDAELAAAATGVALQQIAARRFDPVEPFVLSATRLEGGTAYNVLPMEARIGGTFRTLDDDVRRAAGELIRQVAVDTARAHGCEADVALTEGYPITANDPAATARFMQVAARSLSAERVGVMPRPVMGGEDFSYYGHHVPACFFVLGLHEPGTPPMAGLHHPAFDFNDAALATGIELFCALAVAG